MLKRITRAAAQSVAAKWVLITVVLIFILGTGIHLLDLTDPPLDYFPQRQLRAAIIARAMYYQMLPNADPVTRATAVYLSQVISPREPSVFEGLVALTYLVTGGEHLWIARLYAILFWLLGGIPLYLLARRLTSPVAAIAPLIFYFFIPWSVLFSRTFLPDLIMVMMTLWVAYTLYRWGETPTWRWSITSGLLAGLAAYIKLPAIIPIGFMMLFVVLTTFSFKKAIKNPQVWMMAGLLIIFPAIYYLFFIPGNSSAYFKYTLQLLGNLVQPSFYIRWIIFTDGLVDLGVAFVSFVGVWLLPKKARAIPLALWISYIVYGMVFSYHITTHEYYHIPLIPVIALSLAPLAGLVMSQIGKLDRLARWGVVAVVVFSVAYSGWMARSIMYAKNYRTEAISWQKVGEALPKEGDLIGITHEQGIRLVYYGWRHVNPWQYTAADELALNSTPDPQAAFAARFKDAVIGQEYFVITMFGELDAQPMLKAYLYDHFHIYSEGDGYLIFDLTQPKAVAP